MKESRKQVAESKLSPRYTVNAFVIYKLYLILLQVNLSESTPHISNITQKQEKTRNGYNIPNSDDRHHASLYVLQKHIKGQV